MYLTYFTRPIPTHWQKSALSQIPNFYVFIGYTQVNLVILVSHHIAIMVTQNKLVHMDDTSVGLSHLSELSMRAEWLDFHRYKANG